MEEKKKKTDTKTAETVEINVVFSFFCNKLKPKTKLCIHARTLVIQSSDEID